MAEEKKSASAQGAKKPKLRFRRWFRELKAEMKKIVWPNRKQVINNTVVVIAAVLIVGAFVWAVDLVFSYGRDIIISTLG